MSEGLEALRLLVVDDNAQMRSIIGAVLTGAGVRHLHFAPHGVLGLEALSVYRPDVIYVDYEMPVMNGLEFVAAVRGRETDDRYIPIIMVTGHSDLVRLNRARDLGVTEFVAKPVSAKTLLNRLHAVITNPRPFIYVEGFFGPDRRRIAKKSYAGPLRRQTDVQISEEI